jgi:Beta-ketoacyl synthase, N-terminal domain
VHFLHDQQQNACTPEQVTAASATGNGLAFMVGRISYSLGLTGADRSASHLDLLTLVGSAINSNYESRCSGCKWMGGPSSPRPWCCGAGPCIGMDTACSSSLITTHLAANALSDGEASSALTAGINVMLSPMITSAICQLQVRATVRQKYSAVGHRSFAHTRQLLHFDSMASSK